jgi:hypothetical protein
MYTCICCNIEKDDNEFYSYKNTLLGHDKTCKVCRKEKVRKYREYNIEKVKEYDRNRPNHKERIEKCKERYKQKRNSGDIDFLEKDKERIRKYRSKFPEKYKAHSTVNNALGDGKLIKPTKCEHCHKEKKLQAHHWSYEEEHWLDVIWLCTRCHADEHVRLNELGRDPDSK